MGKEQELTAALRQLAEEPTPPGLEKRILGAIARQDDPLLRRIMAWARRPVEIRLTLQPWKLAPAMACLIIAGYATLALLLPGKRMAPMAPADPSVSEGLVRLEFVLDQPGAETVALIGSFNGWQRETGQMQPVPGSHSWRIVVDVPPGRHEYAFLVDGSTLLSDPQAAFAQSDGFGSTNSIVFADTNGIKRL
jgi:hypothetical protein